MVWYGLYGLKHHIVEISGDVTDPEGRTNEQPTSKYRATQLFNLPLMKPHSQASSSNDGRPNNQDDQQHLVMDEERMQAV